MYYKVVTRDLKSACIGQGVSYKEELTEFLKTITVQYAINIWIKPKLVGSKLFLFDSMYSVREFIRESSASYYGPRVFQCEAWNVEEIRHPGRYTNIEDYWNGCLKNFGDEVHLAADLIKLGMEVKIW